MSTLQSRRGRKSIPMAKKKTGTKSAPSLIARAKKIRVLLMDVDGVLTDGRIWLLSRRDGTASEIKGFSAYDGAGLSSRAPRDFAPGSLPAGNQVLSRSAPGNAKLSLYISTAPRNSAPLKRFYKPLGPTAVKLPTSATIFRIFLCCTVWVLQLRLPTPFRK